MLARNSRDIVLFVSQADGRLLEANHAAVVAYGYSREELLNLGIQALRCPATREEAAQQMKRALKTGLLFETLHVRKDGTIFPVEVSSQGAVIDGTPTLVSIIRDISQRKAAERDVAAANRALRTISECNQAIMRATDEQELLQAICQICVTIGGYRMAWVAFPEDGGGVTPVAQAGFEAGYLERAQITWVDTERGRGPVGTCIRTGLLSLCRNIPEDPAFSAWREEALNRGYTSCISLPLRLQERTLGALNLYSAEADVFHDNEVRLLRELTDDLTFGIGLLRREAVRQKTETTLKQTEARLRLLGAALEAAANAIVITDQQGNIEWANAAFTHLSGWDLGEVRGRNPREFLKSGKHDPAFYKRMWETLSEGKVWRGEIVNRCKNGQLRTEDMTITPVRDEAGRILHHISIKQDITEKKRMEAHLLQSQRLESLGTLAGGIAHDLNNILAPIVLASSILRRQLPDEQDRALVAMAETSAKRGAEIIRQLLTFSRGDAGERGLVQLRYIAKEILQIMRQSFPGDIRIRFDLAPDLWPLPADPTQLHQVLLNLCVNARDAMPVGGDLSLQAANARLDEGDPLLPPGSKPGPYVRVAVRDTGQGIAPEIKHRIFDPFFTTKPVGKGTGLGLSTVLGIVRAHGGFMQVDSALEQGTIFRVYLPAHPEGVAAGGQDVVAIQAPAASPATILVVEDEQNVREVTRLLLERQAYRVITACNGEEALARYLSLRPQIKLVITDLVMPGINGTDLIRALRVLDGSLKIIATTGLMEEPRMRELAELNVCEVLPKPCDSAVLLERVRFCLEEKGPSADPATVPG